MNLVANLRKKNGLFHIAVTKYVCSFFHMLTTQEETISRMNIGIQVAYMCFMDKQVSVFLLEKKLRSLASGICCKTLNNMVIHRVLVGGIKNIMLF